MSGPYLPTEVREVIGSVSTPNGRPVVQPDGSLVLEMDSQYAYTFAPGRWLGYTYRGETVENTNREAIATYTAEVRAAIGSRAYERFTEARARRDLESVNAGPRGERRRKERVS